MNKFNIYCNKNSIHIDAMKFAVYCINNNIELDKLTDEQIDKEKAKFDKLLEGNCGN